MIEMSSVTNSKSNKMMNPRMVNVINVNKVTLALDRKTLTGKVMEEIKRNDDILRMTIPSHDINEVNKAQINHKCMQLMNEIGMKNKMKESRDYCLTWENRIELIN